MGEEQQIFMHIVEKKVENIFLENILPKFWMFHYGCVLKQFKKKCKQIFQRQCLV